MIKCHNFYSYLFKILQERLKIFQFTLSWTMAELSHSGLRTYSMDIKSYCAT